MTIIWRPYVSIKESVATFDPLTLYKFGCMDIYRMLRLFNDKITNNNFYPFNFPDNSFSKYYWNDGKPAIRDLIDYLYEAEEKWLENGGEILGFDKQIVLDLEKTEFSRNHVIWTEEQARNHRYILLSYNYFWWKRHFRKEEEYTRRLFKVKFFENNVPHGIKLEELDNLTEVFQKVIL